MKAGLLLTIIVIATLLSIWLGKKYPLGDMFFAWWERRRHHHHKCHKHEAIRLNARLGPPEEK